jgi:predicted SAM-dependent methyltransferase
MTDAASADLPAGLLEERGADRLHIGGKQRRAGWQVLNILPGENVDHVGDARDLSRFADESFDMVYASHILEHLSHRGDLQRALAEVARILRPAGRFFISVPDLKILSSMLSRPGMPEEDCFRIMYMMFGSQRDAHDFHCVGLWQEYLASLLGDAGFSELYRVERFGLFHDDSETRLHDVLISLNAVAVK